MNDHMTWHLRGAEVKVVNKVRFSRKFLPDAAHGLYVQKALDVLSADSSFTVPATATIDELPWPVKATVQPNDGRQVVWAVHTRHADILQPDQETLSALLSPFVYVDRDQPQPTTKSLTLNIGGTNSQPVLLDAYAGPALPPLPWQVLHGTSMSQIETSIQFWREHSFVYDISNIASTLHEVAPLWHAGLYVPSFAP